MSLLGGGQSRGPSGILIKLDLPGTTKASEASGGGQLPAPPPHAHAAGRTAEAVAACAHLFMRPVLDWVSLPRNAGLSWRLTALGDFSCGLSGQWVQRARVGCTCSWPQAPRPTSGQSAEGSWRGGVAVPGLAGEGEALRGLALRPPQFGPSSWCRALAGLLPLVQARCWVRPLRGSSGLCSWSLCCIPEMATQQLRRGALPRVESTQPKSQGLGKNQGEGTRP